MSVSVAWTAIALADHIKSLRVFQTVRRRSLQNMLYHIHGLTHVRVAMSVNTANMVTCTIAGARLNYSNSFSGMSEANFDRRQRVQNSLARVLALIGVITSSRFLPSFTGYPSEQDLHSRLPQWLSRSDGHINHHTYRIWSKNTSRSGHFDPHPSWYLINWRFEQWLVVVRSDMSLSRLGTVFWKQQARKMLLNRFGVRLKLCYFDNHTVINVLRWLPCFRNHK